MKLHEVQRLKRKIELSTAFRDLFLHSPPYTLGVGFTDQDRKYRLAVRLKSQNDRDWFHDHYSDLLKAADTDILVVGDTQTPPAADVQPSPAVISTGPLQIGGAVRHVKGRPGSLGFFATRFGVRGFVSCNHVIALTDRARSGEEVAGATPGDVVGELVRFHRLRRAFSVARQADCAFAEVRPDRLPETPGLLNGDGPIDPRAPALAEMRSKMAVRKIGPVTQKREGMIRSVFPTQDFGYANHSQFTVRFTNVIEIESGQNFADRGDSGSLVYSTDNRPVGLLFRESPQTTQEAVPTDPFLWYANPIAQVLRALDAQIAVTW